MHPFFCPVYVLDRQMQEGTSPPKWTKRTTQKVYVGHLHHYSKSVPMVWDPKQKLVSPKCHVMFDDNFDTVQAPHPIKNTQTQWTDYSKQISINMMIPSEMIIHIFIFSRGSRYTPRQPNTKH
jgi:hypothetical protein